MDKNRFLIELSESNRTDFGKVDFLQQPKEQSIFSVVWALESQVNNGGFSQYFSSWDGETASYAPTALKSIGADACATIVEQALALVSSTGLPASHDARVQLMAMLNDEARQKLEVLDSAFYSYPDDLTELLYQYVCANPGAFACSD